MSLVAAYRGQYHTSRSAAVAAYPSSMHRTCAGAPYLSCQEHPAALDLNNIEPYIPAPQTA
eukprot:2675392-Rhodomonas_salina.1